MKKYETLKKNYEKMTDADFLELTGNNEDVNMEKKTRREKMSLLTFAEISEAIKNSKYELVLDCNYAESKFHNHKDVSEDVYLIDYACIVSKSDTHTRVMQIYATTTNDSTYYRICTTCKKALRDAQTLDNIGFTTRYDKKTGRAKTSEKKVISYDNIVSEIKTLISVLEK